MKTKSFFLTFTVIAFLVSCNTPPPKEGSETAKKDSTCCKSDSTCKQHADYAKIIAAKIYIKAGKEAEFTQLFKAMIDSTVKEPGCTGYELFQNPYEKSNFLVFETYKNQAAIDAHFAAAYFKSFGDKIGPLTAKATEIIIYDIAKEEKK